MVILEGQKDHYVLIRTLSAQSGEATIYLCENQDGAQFAARLYPTQEGLNGSVRDFLYHVQSGLMKLLDHGAAEIEGIPRAFEIYVYMKEGTLASHAPLDEYYIEKNVIPCMNETLHAMHEAGFLHRDVKPDNMYGDTESNDGYPVKLGDFGITVSMGQEGHFSDAALSYTPGYVPAEVLGTAIYSPASDYYGLAVSIYYLLTGRQIFDGLQPDEIMIRTRRGELMHYEGISKRLASLLEGLTVQDPRYRWGYQEVKAWVEGANVPVFRHIQEEKLLDPPYQLTARITCSSLRELAAALAANPEEGRKHLYGKLLSDSLRTQYQHLASELTSICNKYFPYNQNAGLAAAIHLIDPYDHTLYWNGKEYRGIFTLLEQLKSEILEEQLSDLSREILCSGILSYHYEDMISDSDLLLIQAVERDAKLHEMTAACELVLRLYPEPCYQITEDVSVRNIAEYIRFLENTDGSLKEQFYRDFNRTYFQCWLGAIGYGVAFREWKEFFYKNGSIPKERKLVGNACQFLERICPAEKALLRAFVIRYLKKCPEYWVKEHLDLYEMDEMLQQVITENFSKLDYTEDMPVAKLLEVQYGLKEHMNELRRDFLNNISLYQMTIYNVTDYRITSSDAGAYFVKIETGELVPLGWIEECGDAEARKSLPDGLDDMKRHAEESIENFFGKLYRWSRRFNSACAEKKRKHKIPGLTGTVLSLSVSVISFVLCLLLSQVYLSGSGIITKIGFMLLFLAAVLIFSGAVVRAGLYVRWRMMKDSLIKLEQIATEADNLKNRIRQSTIATKGKISTYSHNLETEAQRQRAFIGYVLSDKRGKNSLLGAYMVLFLSIAILGTGLYMDGRISLSGLDGNDNPMASIMNDLLHRDSDRDSENQDDGEIIFKVVVRNARLRSGAGTSYENLNSYDQGTTVIGTGRTQSDGTYIWYEVITPDGTTGWMRNDTIEKQ